MKSLAQSSRRRLIRRGLVAGVVMVLIFLSGGTVHLFHQMRHIRDVCDDFMRRYSPPFAREQTVFTLFLNNHPTAGEVVGFKPGWKLEYKDAGSSAGVTYYADVFGKIIHSEPLGWAENLEKWKAEGKPAGFLNYGEFNRISNALALVPAVNITKSWHNLDSTFEEFGFNITYGGQPLQMWFDENDAICDLPKNAIVPALKKRIHRELGLPIE